MKPCNIVILAGGFGERLWPVSSKEFPKQFMTLDGGLSFLQQSLKRAFLLRNCGKIVIITRKDILQTAINQCVAYARTVSENDKKRLQENLIVIAEPCQKHTTPPIMLASKYFESIGVKDVPVLVLTSDHCIKTQNLFENDVKKAITEAEKGSFVCFAIPPTEASTGFGYMEVAETNDPDIFGITNFKEKPDFELAKRYLDSGKYWWNSGMFCITPHTFIQEIKKLTPEVFAAFDDTESSMTIQLENGIQFVDSWEYMDASYEKTIAISIDHAVAEKSKKVRAVKASFEWHDIGTWDSFAEQFEVNHEGNSFIGNVSSVNVKNCFIDTDIPTVLTGVEDLIVSVKDGKILIAKKGSSQDIKEAVGKLEG